MLPKHNRLTSQEIFTLKSQPVKKVYASHLGVFATPSDAHLKVGIIVSKKQFKRAVDRNKIKRQLYHHLASLISLDSPYTLLLVPKRSLLTLPYHQQQPILSQLLKQLGVI